MNKELTLPFSTILASTVHDMKNSLSMIMSTLDDVIQSPELNHKPANTNISVMQYEAVRLNNALMQLLALYKIEQAQLALNMNYHNITELFEDLEAKHAELLQHYGVTLGIDCDESLAWFFDYELISIALANIITNAVRYTKTSIELSAELQDGMLRLSVADDGTGYPALILTQQRGFSTAINPNSGSTGLGLYFASQLAAFHVKPPKQGFVLIENGTKLSGGHFQMVLP